jgi:hypothetical protein
MPRPPDDLGQTFRVQGAGLSRLMTRAFFAIPFYGSLFVTFRRDIRSQQLLFLFACSQLGRLGGMAAARPGLGHPVRRNAITPRR